jgi:AAA+ ATPase superfamily predicted ATPase
MVFISNYFDLSVKNNREDLYDRERELAELMEGIQTPVTAVIGMRRTGKSSLINVGLEGAPHITVDLRGIGPNPSPLAILQRFERAINSTKLNSLWNTLSKVAGITIGSVGIQLSRKRGEYPDLQSVVDMIQEWAEKQKTRFVIALDEAQEARGYKILQQVIAHSYDYNKNLAFMLAGSEIGLLYDFLGQEDEKSALYGRHIHLK